MSTSIVTPRPSEFNWASSRAANLKEPITALKEKGWQYADVPTASNFNWLINELAKWDKYLEGRVNGTADDLREIATAMQEHNKTLRRDLKIVVGTLEAIIERVLAHHPNPPFLRQRLPTFDP